jgi:hypothetical protein
MSNGRIREYEIYLSSDGKDWGEPVLKGNLPDSPRVRSLDLPSPEEARFLRLVVLSDHSGGGYAALGEIEIY